jgi:Carboxypeptidase regulatory-like domain
MKSLQARSSLIVVLAALLTACAPLAFGQTPETGALTGTVTDPSGAVISGATVTITSVSTGQSRTTTTDSSGLYKFGLLNPDSYKVTFSASGFKLEEVPSVAVHVTETQVLNRSLQVGTQTQQVTVEATAEAIQTENATNGGVVDAQEVTSLPLVSRNYTQIINLSPGVVANATTASSIGNGTEDVSANGSRGDQNNYLMDGSSVVNYVSGTASQSGSFPGIAIPNPDSIQEFKVQTSQYDASSGRNPGANVEVITKSGTNQFHGDVWEFNRNNFFDANDFFYKHFQESETPATNHPQTLKQNTFGGTIGGPIKKDKIFFFGSYQGIRQINGIGTSGFAFGYTPNTFLMPWNDYADFDSHVCSDVRCTNNPAAYRAYLGSIFAGFPDLDGVPVAADGSNISNTAIAYLQAKGLDKGPYNQGFYFPSMTQAQFNSLSSGSPACINQAAPSGPPTLATVGLLGCETPISEPIHANENQYLANTDYVLSSKHTLSEKFMFSTDPQTQTFNCFINGTMCNPGAPINALYQNYVGQLKLTSVLTSNFVNEARFSFHRDIENNTDPTPVLSCDLSSTANVIPLINNGAPCPLVSTGSNGALAKKFPELNVIPILDNVAIFGGAPWSQGGNFSMISSNFINTFQEADQISWTHGKQTIRAGFEAERVQYNNTIPAAGRGELLLPSTADFLTSSAGTTASPFNPNGYNDGTPATIFSILGGFGLKGPLIHYNRINAFDWYVQDDIKVNRKLTVNLGLRWEYDGFPDDVSGQFTNIWLPQLLKYNTGSAFLSQPACPADFGYVGTLLGFVVPSNFDPAAGFTGPCGETGVLKNSNKTLLPGSPWHNFAPRIGVAWQPLGEKFVVRAGYGMFYDRVYGNLLIDNQLNLPPYAGTAAGVAPFTLNDSLHDPWYAAAQVPFTWTPRYIGGPPTYCPGGLVCGFTDSDLTYTSDSPVMANRLPMVQQYSLDFQYEVAHGWVLDVGYVGTHSIHLYNYAQGNNFGLLVPGAPNNPTAAAGPQNLAMVQPVPFNDAANPTPVQANVLQCYPCGILLPNATSNADVRSQYLGFNGGLATTTTAGDALYNSLQAQIRHQFSHGLLLQVAYTWSKEFTNVDAAESGGFLQPNGGVLNGSSNSNNPLNLAQSYGLAAFERPQRLVISYVYALPSKHAEGVTGKVLSGWSVSGVGTIQSGQPFTITDSDGGSIYGLTTSRALLADPVDCDAMGNCKSGIAIGTTGSDTQRALTNWLNIGAFQKMCTVGSTGLLPAGCTTPLPASSPYCIGGVPNPGGSSSAPCGAFNSTFPGAGTGFGNSSVGTVFGPDQVNFDMALVKDTKIWEQGTLEFRAEAFNIWNHPQFLPPGDNVDDPSTFGLIQGTANTPRVMQFGLKLLF